MPDRGETAVSREILHQEGFYPEQSSGLFVGISIFEDDRFAPVRFAVDDAVDLAWVFSLELGLIDPLRCVLAIAGEPQKEVSRHRLEGLLAAGAKRELPRMREVYRLVTQLSQSGNGRGLFVISAATHGLSEQGGDYLIAADSLRDRLLKTGIEVKDLFDSAATAMPRRRIMVLDACRERLSQGTKSIADPGMSQSFAGAITKATGLTVLSGSTAGGYSYDDQEKRNGVFTGALVEGLLGAAPADSRGFITVSTLADFAQDRVQAWIRQHRREHLDKSRGIEHRFDEAARQLPLAIDPRRSRAVEEYQRRRALALIRLKENIGEILDGRSFDDIKAFLTSGGFPSRGELRLLDEIEALDGGERAQRSMLHLFWEIRRSPQAAQFPRQPRRRVPRWGFTVGMAIVLAVVAGIVGISLLLRESKERAQAMKAETVTSGQPILVEPLTKQVEVPAVKHTEPGKSLVVSEASAGLPEIATESAAQDSATSAKETRVSPSRAVLEVSLAEPKIVEQRTQPGSGRMPPDFKRVEEPITQARQPSIRQPGQLRIDFFGLKFRWIPGGTYSIGSPELDSERLPWEPEPHLIELNGFWLAQTEVTQAFWTKQGLKNPSAFKGNGECPVERVSWFEAVMFANLLSEKAGLEACYELTCSGILGDLSFQCSEVRHKRQTCSGYRLPTEVEWEVAARAQALGVAYQPRYGDLGEIAWYRDNGNGKTHPVETKKANSWQLHDMLGNVYEWTWDMDGIRVSDRILKGGSWVDGARAIRPAYRNGNEPNYRPANLGFRLALGDMLSSEEVSRAEQY